MSDQLDRLVDMFTLGGPIVAILLALAVFALAIVLLKCWQFAIVRISSRKAVDRALALWAGGQQSQAIDSLPDKRQPLARVVKIAMRGQLMGLEEPLVREETLRVGNADIATLHHYLRPLELIGIICPLLGLLGTVIGMIDAFQSMENAGAQVDPAVLSGGIWQALLTTAVGLTVAIPVTVAHSWLERKVERLGHEMEDATTQVFTWRMRPGSENAHAASAGKNPVVPGTALDGD
ncbi:MAG: MotA/TolQ/ExbB proton channel family protein [Burkholderiaceae bacterium]